MCEYIYLSVCLFFFYVGNWASRVCRQGSYNFSRIALHSPIGAEPGALGLGFRVSSHSKAKDWKKFMLLVLKILHRSQYPSSSGMWWAFFLCVDEWHVCT